MSQGPREEIPLHMQNDIQKHMQLLLMRQKETDEKMLSLETYQSVIEPAGSFLWAIGNWWKISAENDPQLFLSRKFKFAGKVSMHLQMVVKLELVPVPINDVAPVTNIEIYAILSNAFFQPLPFSILLVGDTTTKKHGNITKHRKILARYSMLQELCPVQHGNILLVKLEW